MCQKCPEQSRALSVASTLCTCEAGYYRSLQDPKSAPCTSNFEETTVICFSLHQNKRLNHFLAPPSRPEQAEVVSVEQTSAIIKWNKPKSTGGRHELWYRIECRECPPGTQFIPAKSKFNATRVTLNNLEPSMVYTIFVYAENEISSQVDGLPMYAVVEVQTKNSSPVHVLNLKIESVSENQISLSWDPPQISMDYEPLAGGTNNAAPVSGLETELERRKQLVQYYQIRYYMRERPNNFTTKTSTDTKFTVNGLSDNSDYFFEVSNKLRV